MGHIRDKMIEDMKMRGFRKNTQQTYEKCVRLFIRHFMQPPEQLGELHIRQFLLHKIEHDGIRPSTHSTYVAAIRFLYKVTLGRPEEVQHIASPKVQQAVPQVLTVKEVQEILAAVRSFKHRVILAVTYGAGLRISEVCALKPSDIDSQRGLIHVRDAKGGRDRYAMLAQRLVELLRAYYRLERPHPPYLFPGKPPQKPISREAVSEALRAAVKRTTVQKVVTPHLFRHSFATHMLEMGTSTREVQALLGHRSIRSTEHYLTVSSAHIANLKSPIERIDTTVLKP